MNQNVKIIGIAVIVFLIGSVANNFAVSNVLPNFKVAIVDVQKVVMHSTKVNQLKEEQKGKIKDLSTFVEKAKADVAAEKDTTKRKKLEDKYNEELNARKNTINKDYAEKLALIDKNISEIISEKAKEKNYNLVLSKGIVLYGGDDITNDVSKAVE